jgi:hypothetical protein
VGVFNRSGARRLTALTGGSTGGKTEAGEAARREKEQGRSGDGLGLKSPREREEVGGAAWAPGRHDAGDTTGAGGDRSRYGRALPPGATDKRAPLLFYFPEFQI